MAEEFSQEDFDAVFATKPKADISGLTATEIATSQLPELTDQDFQEDFTDPAKRQANKERIAAEFPKTDTSDPARFGVPAEEEFSGEPDRVLQSIMAAGKVQFPGAGPPEFTQDDFDIIFQSQRDNEIAEFQQKRAEEES